MKKLIIWVEGWLPILWCILGTVFVTAFLSAIAIRAVQWVLTLLGVM